MKSNGLMPVIEKKDKAVSPIIATILLVAITVILASTLYLALGGFFSPKSVAPTASVSGTNTSTANTPSYTVSVSSLSSTTIPITDVELLITYAGGSQTITLAQMTGSGGAHFNATSSIASGDLTNGASFTITGLSGQHVWATSIAVIDTGSNGGTLGTWTVP